MSTIAQALQQLIKDSGKSPTDVSGEISKCCRVSYSTARKWINGSTKPGRASLKEIADHFEVHLASLEHGIDDELFQVLVDLQEDNPELLLLVKKVVLAMADLDKEKLKKKRIEKSEKLMRDLSEYFGIDPELMQGMFR